MSTLRYQGIRHPFAPSGVNLTLRQEGSVMRKAMLVGVFIVVGFASGAAAQQTQQAAEAELRRLVPYSSMLAKDPTLTLDQYNRAVQEVARQRAQETTFLLAPPTRVQPRTYAPAPTYTPPARTYIPPPSYSYVPPAPSYSYRPPPPTFGSSYDAKSGNRYSWYTLGEDTVVRGSNARTGSMWRSTIKPDGSMRGTDSNFNPWRYDAQTGRYTNFGTGVTCIGQGYARTCY